MKLWAMAAVVPAVAWAALLAAPAIDRRWESHPAHFWLVLFRRARKRRDPVTR